MPLNGMRVIRGDDAVEMGYRRHRAASPRGWIAERFDATLAAHAVASGARLLERTALDDVHWRGGQDASGGRVVGASLRTADGRRTVRSRWLIGADGADRRGPAPERRGRRGKPRRLGLIAHYEGLPELADHGEMHVARDWHVGLAPLAGNRLNVGMALPMDERQAVGRGAPRRQSTASRRSPTACEGSSG